ncbi:Fic family protein [Schleiferilactobacillus shenzhenensis]|uniref:Fido domain-containing protein n=1 Tax=Schleiferilactobacillus shenzhenensis LY-73 TaxID=1231336 RepID=U4TLQ5_9LACO|nr:Fic family protein [Schleiferilactobacillus shenzhenensis]ERL65149.1 hypothetical protein L248_3087 [Schleiferilactobacillus shenzhenensis LY-73]
MADIDNTALAHFIVSLGSLNDYGSSAYQTKQALDQHTTAPLRQDNADTAIFTDALNGLAAIDETGFSTAGIIAVNRQFSSPSDEEPRRPGHLRDARSDPYDRVAILVNAKGTDAYYPPTVVTWADLDRIVTRYQHSPQRESDAWRIFAAIAKLQPFQDGNKRTALIAANAAYGGLARHDYLILPAKDLDRVEFMVLLLRYYVAADEDEEASVLARMLTLLPSPAERHRLLQQPITDTTVHRPRGIHVKHQFGDKE